MRNLIRKLFGFPADLQPHQMVVEVFQSPQDAANGHMGVRLLGRKDNDAHCFDLLNNILAAGAINLPPEYRDQLKKRSA